MIMIMTMIMFMIIIMIITIVQASFDKQPSEESNSQLDVAVSPWFVPTSKLELF